MTMPKGPYLHFLVIIVSIVVLTFFLLIAADRPDARTPLLFLVFTAGMIGGIGNSGRKLQKMPLKVDQDPGRPTSRLTLQLYLSPLIGGVFAVMLYSLFVAEILKGPLFPGFRGLAEDYSGVSTFLDAVKPEKTLDAAKALFWGLAAGFSEGLVPGYFERVTEEMPGPSAKA